MSKRIAWVDIYKAIAIILVVIGHATGQFNQYIYMFHVSAFFFISGFVSKIDKESFGILIIKKIYTIILPLFTSILVHGAFMNYCNIHGIYKKWFGNYSFIGYNEIIRLFLLKGEIWAWLLGPAWFLVVLFFVFVISKLFWILSSERSFVFLLYSVIVYIWGYVCISNNYLMDIPYSLRKVMIAQFYFCVGFLVKKYMNNMKQTITLRTNIVLFMITSIIIIILGHMHNMTIDYASEIFGNPFINTMTCIVGIILIYSISIIISNMSNKFVNVLCIIGENTMGILLLHFSIFKIVYIILAKCSFITYEEIGFITPTSETGKKYWALLVVFSVVLGTIIWEVLKRIKVINCLLGLNKNIINIIYKSFEKKTNAIYGVVLIYAISIAFFVVHLYYMLIPINISFPCEIDDSYVSFEGGWQPQNDEKYRWIEDEGELCVHSFRHNSLILRGYVPENFSEVNNCDIYVNDRLIGRIDLKQKGDFEASYDLKEMISGYKYNILFDFDGIHEPERDSADLRSLSGLISNIYIE